MATIVVGGLLLTAAAGGIAAGAAGATAGAVVVRKKRRAKKLKALRKKLFGEPISTLNPKFLTDKGIPVVIEMTCRQLEEDGADTEGLFRVPGSANRIQILADAFRKGSEKALSKVNLKLEDSHDVGGLFKLYFRSLPEALCTFELYQDFVEVQGQNLETEQWIDRVAGLLRSLPDINRFVFIRILPFFAHVCTFSETNKMSVENMSIVFGPTLFFSSDNDPMSILTNSSHICNLLTKMIVHQEEIVKRVQSTNMRWKNTKKTVNASMLFKKQHMVTELYGADYGEEDLQEEELEAIKELLVDDFAIPEEAESNSIQNGDFFSAPMPVPLEEPPTPPQAIAGKPLPTPPPRKRPATPTIDLEKAPDSPIVLSKESHDTKKPLPVPPRRTFPNKPMPVPNKP